MADRVGPLGFIEAMLGKGIGPTEGLRMYREAGGAIRTQRWFSAYGELAAELARRDMVQAAPLNRPPTGEEISTVASARPGAYLYRGGVMVVDRETGLVMTLPGSVRSQRLVNYGTAIAQMLAPVEESQENYGFTALGAFITGVRELVPVSEVGPL